MLPRKVENLADLRKLYHQLSPRHDVEAYPGQGEQQGACQDLEQMPKQEANPHNHGLDESMSPLPAQYRAFLTQQSPSTKAMIPASCSGKQTIRRVDPDIARQTFALAECLGQPLPRNIVIKLPRED